MIIRFDKFLNESTVSNYIRERYDITKEILLKLGFTVSEIGVPRSPKHTDFIAISGKTQLDLHIVDNEDLEGTKLRGANSIEVTVYNEHGKILASEYLCWETSENLEALIINLLSNSVSSDVMSSRLVNAIHRIRGSRLGKDFGVSESTVSTNKEREPLWDDFLRSLYSDKEWVKSVAEEVKKISGANYILDKIDSDELAMNYASGHQHDHRFPEGDVWRADFDMWEITDSRRNDPPKMYVLGETNARTITNMINKSSMHLGGEAKINEVRRYMWPFELLNYLNRNGWSKVKIAEKWYKPHRGWQLVGQLGI